MIRQAPTAMMGEKSSEPISRQGSEDYTSEAQVSYLARYGLVSDERPPGMLSRSGSTGYKVDRCSEAVS